MEKLSSAEQIIRALRKRRGEKVETIRVEKEDVFRYLCEAASGIGPHTAIRSISNIASAFGATEYNVRKCIKELVHDCLVERSYDGGIDEVGVVWCYHGFCITEIGYETETYKECEKKPLMN